MQETSLFEDQPIAWRPTPDVIERAQLTRFMKQVGVSTWDELYEYSIRDVEKFTEEVLKFLDIKVDPPYGKLLDISDGVEFPKWFGARPDAPVVSSGPEKVFPQSRKDAKKSSASNMETSRPKSGPGAVATGELSPVSEPDSAELPPRQPKRLPPLPNTEGSVVANAGLNITTVCLDRWQTDEMKNQPALIWEGENGKVETYSYKDLYSYTTGCAAGLVENGFGKGDAVGIHLPMIAETIVALLAINRIGAIAVPVFSGYGVDAIASRMNAVNAKGLFTRTGFDRRGKFFDSFEVANEAVQNCPTIEHVFVASCDEDGFLATRTSDLRYKEFNSLYAGVSPAPPEPTSAEDPLIILYTSGTTGKPKGIAHTHSSFPIKAAQDMAFGTDVGKGTRICWYTDIGWMMGPWLIYGALINGATICLYDGAPDYPTHDRMWEFCAKHKVEVLGISPTLVRALAAHEDTGGATGPQASCLHEGEARKSAGGSTTQSFDAAGATALQAGMPAVQSVDDASVTKVPHQRHDLGSLRMFASTGEPWNPAPWWWLFEKVGNSKLPIINYSGGTEISGGILMGNPLLPIKPCSFPAPCPGMDVDILDEEGKSVGPNQVGELVIKQPWIGMARGFWQEKERYLDTYWRRFRNIWVHGDWAMRDKDGHWFILGRSDDTLKVAGKRVGPAEVESLLVAHPLVTEAAVIGVPDEAKGTVMVAFCVLSEPGAVATGELRNDAGSGTSGDAGITEKGRGTSTQVMEADLKALVAKDMGKPLAPSKIHFVSAIPKTRNAKVMRRVLRAAYLGDDSGDLSALENPQSVEEIAGISKHSTK